MKLVEKFTAHPASVGETYLEHLGVAGAFGFKMIVAGCACLIHGLFPFWFTRTGSAAVAELHARMVTNRRRGQVVPAGLRDSA